MIKGEGQDEKAFAKLFYWARNILTEKGNYEEEITAALNRLRDAILDAEMCVGKAIFLTAEAEMKREAAVAIPPSFDSKAADRLKPENIRQFVSEYILSTSHSLREASNALRVLASLPPGDTPPDEKKKGRAN